MNFKFIILSLPFFISSCLNVTTTTETSITYGQEKYIMKELSVADWGIETIMPENWKVTSDSNGVIIEMPKEFPSSFPMHAGYQISRYFQKDMEEDIIIGTREFLAQQDIKVLKDSSFVENNQQCHIFELEIIQNDTTLSSLIYYRQRERDILRMNFTYIETYADMNLMFNHIWKSTR